MSVSRGPRIVSGRFHGRQLRVARGSVTRPARVRLRRSLLDRLQQRIVGARWLDLYSGSGSLGIEALSRGAAFVALVESGREPARVLRSNLDSLGIDAEEGLLVTRALPGLLRGEPPGGHPFDFIAMDPPFALSYDAPALAELCDALADAGRRGWWNDRAELFWEEPSRAPRPDPPGFVTFDEREFGRSRLRFLEWRAETASEP